ncbi:MAG: proline dehydrogenase family protein [Chloroflexi bacterium]|nr:proline dehydrogenase family protein [Chloroflexota bacterium]MBI3732060.1 proline dehydrogenase family protein [Chloroflexota bacterium]
MIRSLLIALSQSNAFRRFVVAFPLSRRVSRRFVAGERLAEGLAAVQRLNQRGLLATFDLLGENVHSADHAIAAANDYIQILNAIAERHLCSNISLKLTQMGLAVDAELCVNNLRRILAQARRHGNFVRLDMEGSVYTQRTLDIYDRLRAEGFDNTGVVIQAYLYRSEDDIRRLAECGAKVRLCKGAYAEPPSIAFPSKADVDANYHRLVEIMWSEQALAKGAVAALATHDEQIIRWAKDEAARRGIAKDRFEFQMLYGIRAQRQAQLAAEGHRFRVYVPFGAQWYPYFMRRLAERPANMIFLIRNLFRSS